ncbi:hypothetical protein PMIN07_011773 [Paraphaeosphaeria minitans]
MICSAIRGFFARLITYRTGKSMQKAARRRKARDRKASEQKWAEGHRQVPPSAAQRPGASEGYNVETEDCVRSMRTEQPAKKTVGRKLLKPWQRSLETLEIGRIGTAEKFYRQ